MEKLFSLLPLLLLSSTLFAAPSATALRASYEPYFDSAAVEFGVPSELLRAIAWVETRWTHRENFAPADDGRPPAIGIMGLREDEFFGHTLSQAAVLLHSSTERLIHEPRENIRGAAAVLASLHAASEYKVWESELREYAGLGFGEAGDFYVEEIHRLWSQGLERNGARLRPLPPAEGKVYRDYAALLLRNLGPSAAASDPEWDPSPNFTPASIQQKYIVIHTTQGSFASAVAWLKNPVANASSHYVIRSSDGYIKQLVAETDKAWHARCWNPVSIGIEHEGFVEVPDYYTDSMYLSSARLSSEIAKRYAIPIDDMHVFGHDFWSTERYKSNPPADLPACNDHTDPGQFWDWARYLKLVAG